MGNMHLIISAVETSFHELSLTRRRRKERITERSLYEPIISHLRTIGFSGVQEIEVVGYKYPDIVFWENSTKFVLQIKIGFEKLIDGIVAAREHASSLETDNVIACSYPPEARSPLIQEIDTIALDTPTVSLILTDYWSDKFDEKKITVRQLLNELATKVKRKETYYSMELVIDTLREAITTISHLLRRHALRNGSIIDTVVGRFDLFLALGESGDTTKQDMQNAAIDLSSYILVNQILFYHLYSALSRKVEPFRELKSIEDLQPYFKRITDINYCMIYEIKILENLPRLPEINEAVIKCVKGIKSLNPEKIKHDLLGRLFHELLPPATRKVLAAFYTKPSAAEILATLTIDDQAKTIYDFACGSGTLLVSAYRQKLRLLDPTNDLGLLRAHTRFVENDITGLDIMPFAGHLTAINLAAQNFKVTTNKVRVGIANSLTLRPGAYDISSFSRYIQYTFGDNAKLLQDKGGKGMKQVKGTVPMQGERAQLVIKSHEISIMNPPFTDREKMPKDFRNALSELDDLEPVCGGQINLWGYFVALADKLLVPNGKQGLIIPINICRGAATKKLREYLLDNYKIDYIVKATRNMAFTEGAQFRDVLLVAEKRLSRDEDWTGIVYLKKDLNRLSLEEARTIAEDIKGIREGSDTQTQSFDIRWIRTDELSANKSDLVSFVAFQDVANLNEASKFLELCLGKGSPNLVKFTDDEIPEGFHASPKGLSQLTFITRASNESRLGRAFLILDDENDNTITAHVKGTKYRIRIDKNKTIPALRSATSINTMCIDGKNDYMITTNEYEGYNNVKMLSKWQGNIRWQKIADEGNKKSAYLALIRRVNVYSPNTHLLAFFSASKFVSPHTLRFLKGFNIDDSKILCLFLNSIVFIAHMFVNKAETTGSYPDLMIEDLINMYRINPESLTAGQRTDLIELFDNLSETEFPSIREQLDSMFAGRVELDKGILHVLGLSNKEIEMWLPKIYSCITKEMDDFLQACQA